MFKSQLFKEEKKKFKFDLLSIFGVIALVVLVSVFGYYAYIFRNFKIEPDVGHFAQFGDFIGGILNPIFAFLAFIALLYTIKLQSKALKLSKEELSATRKELAKSAEAQQEQSKSLELQNNATKIQMFENTFFRLLSESNSLLDELYQDEDGKAIDNKLGKLSQSDVYLNEARLREEFTLINTGNIKTYFMMMYQVLKFIDNTELVTDKKSYTNIIRVNLESKVLSLLAVNCYINDYPKYKGYIEKYSFFEHLDISSDELFFMEAILKKGYEEKIVYGSNKDLIECLENKRRG